MQAFAGIDVAFANGKPLPVSVCTWRSGRLEPLHLRGGRAPQPPRGRGNRAALDERVVEEFADRTAEYLHEVERCFGVTITRIGIDAPSEPKATGARRRLAELALDARRISCITTPDQAQFLGIRTKALAHLNAGNELARVPHANQLWMLVGFALFARLQSAWECLEVFPQATAVVLGAASVHKRRREGVEAQLQAAAAHTGWPSQPAVQCLSTIARGSLHDRLDAYLAAWVASLDEDRREPLGKPPTDVIWVPRI